MLGKRPISTDLLAIAILLAMTLAFFASALLSPGMFTGGDVEAFYLPYWTYISEALRQGHIPLWNPYVGLGVPLQADSETAIFYLPTTIFHLFPGYRTYIALVAAHVLLSGIFIYLFAMRLVRLSALAAIVAATVAMFSGYTASQVGHFNIIASGAWLAVLVFLYAKLLLSKERGAYLTYGLLAAMAFALEILAQGSQIIYLTFFVLPILGLCIALPERRWRRLAMSLPVILLVAFLLSAVQVLPTVELASQSVRSSGLSWDEATAYSVEPFYLVVTSLMPAFFFASLDGAGSAPYAQTMGYAGIVALAATAFAMKYGRRDRYLAFAVATLTVSLFFATGKFNPFYRLLYDFLPGADRLRVPGRWLFLTVFSLAFLAGIGIDALWSRRGEYASTAVSFCRRLAVVAFAIVSALTVAHFLTPNPSLLFERTNPLSLRFLAPVGSAIATAALLYALGRADRRRPLVAAALVIAIFADLLLFSRYLPFNWHGESRSIAAAAAVQSDPSLFRVAKPLNWQSLALLPQRIYEVDAYSAEGLQRFAQLKGALSQNPEPLLDLLNVKYLLVAPSAASRTLTHSPPEGLRVVERSTFLPRAFAVHNARSSTGPEIREEIVKPGFDPRQVVFVESGPEMRHASSTAGKVRIEEYLPEKVRLEADFPVEGYLVLSDTYYPGWRAYVDGRESPIYRANYLLRAVYLGPGSHAVLFQFDPPLFKIGLAVSSAALLVVICALVVLLRMRMKPSSRSSSS